MPFFFGKNSLFEEQNFRAGSFKSAESFLCTQCGHAGVKNKTKTGKNYKYGQ